MLAPDVRVGDEVAHYYFKQFLAGMVCTPLLSSLLSLPSLPPTPKPIPGIHPLPRRMPPGPQTRKPPPGRSRHSEKIRFWLIGGVSTQRIGKDEGVNGEVWEFALRCAWGVHFLFCFFLCVCFFVFPYSPYSSFSPFALLMLTRWLNS